MVGLTRVEPELKATPLREEKPSLGNAIRPFALGRRNSLFADTVKDAKASAALYCIVSTARANGPEPCAYPRRLFAKLPKAKTVEDFEALLPFSSLSGKANL